MQISGPLVFPNDGLLFSFLSSAKLVTASNYRPDATEAFLALLVLEGLNSSLPISCPTPYPQIPLLLLERGSGRTQRRVYVFSSLLSPDAHFNIL